MTGEALQISPANDPRGSPAKEQQAAGVGILLQIMMLVLSFVLGHVLRRHKFYYLPEASASLLIGATCLLMILFSWQKPFFSNFGAIVTFAIFGTFLASMVTGILVYLGGVMFLMYRLPFVECLMFGALISATDPVTVLSIFQVTFSCDISGTWHGYEPLCIGFWGICFERCSKSLLIAMMTMSLVRSHASSGQNFFLVIVRFLETFVGSMSAVLGVLLYIHCVFCLFILFWPFFMLWLVIVVLQNLECCLFVLFPYFSYMLAEGLGLSGIVSILFTGIVMKRYTFSNLSENSQRFVSAFFHLISSLAETFVFIYMGFDIAMEKHSWSHLGFIFFSIVSLLFIIVARGFLIKLCINLCRAANVFSCAYLVNLARPAHRQIPLKHQQALWYSGLRGAMAFALALQSVHDLPEGHGQTIFTATTAIVVLTVLLIGGSTGTMLEALQVVGDAHDGHLGENFEGNNGYAAPYDEGSTSGNKLKMKLKEFRKSAASFTALDKNYLTPFFTSHNGDEEDEEDGLPIASTNLFHCLTELRGSTAQLQKIEFPWPQLTVIAETSRKQDEVRFVDNCLEMI
ncbi:hypothetical protein CUMW_016370, partial [Citrus unshiu]